MTATQSKKINLRFPVSKLGLVIAYILLFILCFNTARAAYNISTFFFSMENIHLPWHLGGDPVDPNNIDAYLSKLKHVAYFVLKAPKTDRYIMIATYNYFIHMDTSIQGNYFERVVNLHLLQLLIFDVPQEYPREQARRFDLIGWAAEKVPYETEDVSNMLWPLGYVHGRLTITAPLGTMVGDYYGGVREYNYFLSRFGFRSIEELN